MIVQTPQNSVIPHPTENPIQILTLGDSYTIGESVSQSQSWPVQLKNVLQREGYSTEDPIIIAKTGWTTSELLAAIEETELQGQFNLVTLLIGVNNQYQGCDIKTYQIEFRALLGLAVKFAGADPSKILVLSIPDWGKTLFNQDRDPFQISAEIDQFNIVNLRECLDAGIQYLNITSISRQTAHNPAMLASDGLHPSGEMYGTWVKLMLPTVLQILRLQ